MAMGLFQTYLVRRSLQCKLCTSDKWQQLLCQDQRIVPEWSEDKQNNLLCLIRHTRDEIKRTYFQ